MSRVFHQWRIHNGSICATPLQFGAVSDPFPLFDELEKKKIRLEMLIGLSCGGAAIFFIILALGIMYLRGNNDTYSDILPLSDSDEVHAIQAEENNNNDENEVKQDKHLQKESGSAVDFWY